MPADVQHEVVEAYQPPNTNIKIWRYLDLPKLIDFLQTRSLHFARSDTLSDPLEGSLTKGNIMDREQQLQAVSDDQEENLTSEEIRQKIRESHHWAANFGRQTIYINCWHGSETESAAMWRQYGTAAGSIAIQSTYERLVSVLPDESYIGLVQYMDYSNPKNQIPWGNIMSPFMHKRKEFEYEKEVRAFIWNREDLEIENLPLGIKKDIDIDKVVETIRVQPTTPDWIRTIIEEFLDHYNCGTKVMESQIDIEPMY